MGETARTLRKRLNARVQAWARPRRPESLPVSFDRRRVYVLPTSFGLFFALLLLAMWLGALNYNNNPALMVATNARQVRERRRIADAFGCNPAAQVMAEVDDGADDRAVLSIPAHLFHEQLVDLQLTHRQASQVGK